MNEASGCAGRIAFVGGVPKSGRSTMMNWMMLRSHKVRQRFVLALFLPFFVLIAGVPANANVTEFVVPAGPRITLQDGREILGHIIQIDQTNIVILTTDGIRETVPRSTVEGLTFDTIAGEELIGELVGWSPGIYQIATEAAAIKVYSAMPAVPAEPEPAPEPAPTLAEESGPEGETVAEEESVAAEESVPEDEATGNLAANAAEVSPPAPASALAAPAPASAEVTGSDQSGSETITAAVANTEPNGIDRDPSQSVAGVQDAAVSPQSDLSIEVSVENSRENGPPVVFNIELSKPSENSVVLIYATIDGTAVNGEDYEANRGVVVIKAGEQKARIEATVIDDSEKEEQEHLQLFLTVDPTVAVVESRQIIATIDDDDQG